MPTGYTANIAKGITFEQYALETARAFGACITLRDEPNAEIPEVFKPDNYHTKQISIARKELETFQKKTPQQLRAAFKKDTDETKNYHRKSIRRAVALRKKYEVMLKLVNKYVPPSPDHEEHKRFMQQQIEESIKFDCATDYHEKQLEARPNFSNWKKDKLKSLRWNVKYHTDAMRKEIDRCASRTQWVQQLREAIKAK